MLFNEEIKKLKSNNKKMHDNTKCLYDLFDCGEEFTSVSEGVETDSTQLPFSKKKQSIDSTDAAGEETMNFKHKFDWNFKHGFTN